MTNHPTRAERADAQWMIATDWYDHYLQQRADACAELIALLDAYGTTPTAITPQMVRHTAATILAEAWTAKRPRTTRIGAE